MGSTILNMVGIVTRRDIVDRNLSSDPCWSREDRYINGPVRGSEDFSFFPFSFSFPKDLGTITVYYQMNRRIKEYRYSKPG